MQRLIFTLLLITPYSSIAQSFSTDTSFGDYGVAICAEANRIRVAYDLVQLPDEKLLAAGLDYAAGGQFFYESFLTRFHTDGRVDSSFGTQGSVHLVTGHKNMLNAIALQVDKKIVAGGNEIIILQQNDPPSAQILSRPFIARFHPNGTRDSSFGTNGIHHLNIMDVYPDKELASLVVCADGRIIVGGSLHDGSQIKMWLVCLNADGSYHTNFGNSGLASYTLEQGQHTVLWHIAVQTDNKILMAGSSGSLSLIDPPDSRFALARVQANGNPDTGFGTQGVVITPLSQATSNSEQANRIHLLPDGRMVVAGTAAGSLTFACYHPDGTLDTDFGQDGKIVHTTHPAPTGFVVRNGKLYTCGTIINNDGSYAHSLSAFLPDGWVDSTFAGNGHTATNIYHQGYQHAMLLQQDGKLVTGGSFRDSNNVQGMLLVRFMPDTTIPSGIPASYQASSSVKMYPNPAEDYIWVEQQTGSTYTMLHILNINGQEVYRAPLSTLNSKISVDNLAAGIYCVQLINRSDIQVRRFLKR